MRCLFCNSVQIKHYVVRCNWCGHPLEGSNITRSPTLNEVRETEYGRGSPRVMKKVDMRKFNQNLGQKEKIVKAIKAIKKHR